METFQEYEIPIQIQIIVRYIIEIKSVTSNGEKTNKISI